MKLSQIGEFKVIQEHVLSVLGRRSGLGDDCGWMDLGDGRMLLVSTDAMMEGSHYRRQWMSGAELARKAFRAALSDLSAMGGAEKMGCVVTLGERADTPLSRHREFMQALKSEARRQKTTILGGDLVEAQDKEFVCFTVFGTGDARRFLKRSGAKKGETLWLTGPVGRARAGLEILERSLDKKFPSLALAHKVPPVRMHQAMLLSHRNLSRCAIDTSDTLAASLLWIARSSPKLDLEINLRQLPVSPVLNDWSRKSGRGLEDYLLYGGEDYEILFSSWCSHRVILRYLPGAIPIGRTARGNGKVRVSGLDGEEFELKEERLGYQAFQTPVAA